VSSGELDEDGDGGLVVGAEDRLPPAAVDAVGELDLDRVLLGDGVQMGEEGHPPALATRNPRDQVARPGAGGRRGAILDHLDAERAQLGRDVIGDRPLLACRARDLAQPHEAIEQALVVGHGGRLCEDRRDVRERGDSDRPPP
jgi:hypothetical protein